VLIASSAFLLKFSYGCPSKKPITKEIIMKPLISLALLGVVGASTTTSQNPLEVLGTALGLTALAGINLYLTVLVTGLAIHMGWLTNYPPALEVLGDPESSLSPACSTPSSFLPTKCRGSIRCGTQSIPSSVP